MSCKVHADVLVALHTHTHTHLGTGSKLVPDCRKLYGRKKASLDAPSALQSTSFELAWAWKYFPNIFPESGKYRGDFSLPIKNTTRNEDCWVSNFVANLSSDFLIVQLTKFEAYVNVKVYFPSWRRGMLWNFLLADPTETRLAIMIVDSSIWKICVWIKFTLFFVNLPPQSRKIEFCPINRVKDVMTIIDFP